MAGEGSTINRGSTAGGAVQRLQRRQVREGGTSKGADHTTTPPTHSPHPQLHTLYTHLRLPPHPLLLLLLLLLLTTTATTATAITHHHRCYLGCLPTHPLSRHSTTDSTHTHLGCLPTRCYYCYYCYFSPTPLLLLLLLLPTTTAAT
jgi:hypothetical protein